MKKHFYQKHGIALGLAFLFTLLSAPSFSSHYIDAQVQGKRQIIEALKAAEGGTLHFISHGRPGQLRVDGQWLGAPEVAALLEEKIKNNPGIRHINIYGCEFGKGTAGKAAVAYLQKTLKVDIAASDNITGRSGDWDLEVGSPGKQILNIDNYPFNLQQIPNIDSDQDGIPDALDLDDDNDGILDSQESVAPGLVCVIHSPNSAAANLASPSTAFPTGRELANTYDNLLTTYGGASSNTASLIGTVTYLYNTPLNNVTEFQFYSNGGGVLTDGQVTNIASIQFYNSSNQLLYQADNVIIPQASVSTPYVLTFPTSLQNVASFTLTDLSDQTHGGSSEAIWKDVFIKTCTMSNGDLDTDNDGIVNRLDLDSDGDGCPDSQEAAVFSTFPWIPFASTNVTNTGGTQPALLSQINLGTFQDKNSNGFDDRLETTTAGSYAGTYTYAKATDNSVATCITELDTDADGIADSVDLDDDNDGILDTNECASTFFWSTAPVVSGNTATGTINGINYTYTSSEPVGTTTSMYGNANFPALYGVPNLNPTIRNTLVTSNTITFASPVQDPVLVLASIGSPSRSVGVNFGAPVEILWSQNVVQNSTTSITGTEGYAIVRMSGIFSSVSFEYTVAESYVNFAFGASITTVCDTDNDGIVNRLDLDSDGDGCPDSQEAAVVASFSNVPFANINVSNPGGGSSALSSQVAASSFQDQNGNGFDDRFETGTAGVYAGVYTYEKAINNTIAACTPLPVTLISFTAKTSTEGNLLEWETTQEKGFDRFSIERSLDLTAGFTSIGNVIGGMNQYKFTDITVGKGHSYYRLKMIDLDGSSAYSRIVHVYQPYGENEHIVFPNPGIKHTVFIHNYFAIQSVGVYDINGNSVKVKITRLNDKYQFDIDPKSAPGIYIIQYRVGAELIRRKFSLN